MRIFTILRGAASATVALVLLVGWLGKGGRESSAHVALTVPPADRSSQVLLGRSASSAIEARQLGLRLLTVADATQIQSGMESLTAAAEEGDAEAQVALGRIYLQGLTAVPRDTARAEAWFTRASAAHHPSAAYYLGVMRQSGAGAPADAAAAARWFEVAANEGSPHAMFLLANAYRAGAGVAKSDARALELYRSAGEREHAPALQALAMAYLHGELGLEPDESESRRYAMEAEHAIHHPQLPP